MMTLFSRILRKTVVLFALWVLFSTIVPSLLARFEPGQMNGSYYADHTSLYTLNGPQVIQSGLTNAHVVLVIAHPDDEVMFFAPSILELVKPDYGNVLSLLCFSSGNAEGLGTIRAQEVARSGQVLGIKDVKVLDSPEFEDSMSLMWDANSISTELETYVASLNTKKVAIMTFDQKGVSGHPNHVSVYHGCVNFAKSRGDVSVWALKTWPVFVKYSGFIISTFSTVNRIIDNSGLSLYARELGNKTCETFQLYGLLKMSEHHGLRITEWIFERFGPRDVDEVAENTMIDKSFTILADVHSVLLSVGDMVSCHYSQIVWFRWLWLLVSKYTNSNELILVV